VSIFFRAMSRAPMDSGNSKEALKSLMEYLSTEGGRGRGGPPPPQPRPNAKPPQGAHQHWGPGEPPTDVIFPGVLAGPLAGSTPPHRPHPVPSGAAPFVSSPAPGAPVVRVVAPDGRATPKPPSLNLGHQIPLVSSSTSSSSTDSIPSSLPGGPPGPRLITVPLTLPDGSVIMQPATISKAGGPATTMWTTAKAPPDPMRSVPLAINASLGRVGEKAGLAPFPLGHHSLPTSSAMPLGGEWLDHEAAPAFPASRSYSAPTTPELGPLRVPQSYLPWHFLAEVDFQQQDDEDPRSDEDLLLTSMLADLGIDPHFEPSDD